MRKAEGRRQNGVVCEPSGAYDDAASGASRFSERPQRSSDLRRCTRAYALSNIEFVESLLRSQTASVIGRQFLRAGTAVGANYRGACRARSKADFIAKLSIVEEAADECLYWLDLLNESGIVSAPQLDALVTEGNELGAMVVASMRTARGSTR
jgi:four helix bundle protein